MKVVIVSPEHKIEHNVAWLELNTPVGNFIIQKGHVPMIVTLAHNMPMTFRLKSGKQKTITPHHGIADITREDVTIIMSDH